MKHKVTVTEINDILPQTQCGLCGYHGCQPYAEAIIKGQSEINQCPPGGKDGVMLLAKLTHKDPKPYLPKMQQKPKMVAFIREDECIGCTKCLTACPVDAILGAAKQMHTVLHDECSGCELCLSPCPVDCIDMIPDNHNRHYLERAKHYKMRFDNKQQRIADEKNNKRRQYQQTKKNHHLTYEHQEKNVIARKKVIEQAIAREKQRKQQLLQSKNIESNRHNAYDPR